MKKQKVEIRDNIMRFMRETFLIEFTGDLTENTDLFITGTINSYGYMQILNYMESAFNVKMSDEELFSNVLTSVAGMVGFVEQKRGNSN